MRRMPQDFVDLTVTSPPYDNLRNYNGFDFDFQYVAQNLFCVTKIGGVVVWVVGETVKEGKETLTPFKQALYFDSIGFSVRTLFFGKKQVPPFNVNTQSFYPPVTEYIFVCSKGKPKTFNPLIDRKNKYAGKFEPTLSKKREKSGDLKSYARNHVVPRESIRTNIWEYNVGRYATFDEIAFEHPAIFPEQLAADCILSWSNENDLIYDPFGGSGTTAKAAHLLKRNWILSEISKEYVELANKRLEPYLMQETLF